MECQKFLLSHILYSHIFVLLRNLVYMFLYEFDRYRNCRLPPWNTDESRCTKLNKTSQTTKCDWLEEYFLYFDWFG